jgi:hypothetical protein
LEPEPEYITIVEGPTPDFRPSAYLWVQSIYESPEDAEIVECELRSLNGPAIVKRCKRAWRQHRPVLLDFPDELRLRQYADVVAMRLQELDEGPLLTLWLRQPVGDYREEELDDGDDDLSL